MERLHILIYGRVIGVGFRGFIKYHADRLNLKGYTKNINDSVYAVFEGQKEALDKVLDLCYHGPPRSHVIKVNANKEGFKNEFTSFNIVY